MYKLSADMGGATFLFLLLFTVFKAELSLAQQVHRCKNASGAMVYQDSACSAGSGGATSITTGTPRNAAYDREETNGINTAPKESSVVSDHERVFSAAIASGDYEKARRLAISQKQRDRVEESIRLIAEQKAIAKQERKQKIRDSTVHCNTNGFSYGGSYSATTTCR